jgi:uncharacterized iron-regulated protein
VSPDRPARGLRAPLGLLAALLLVGCASPTAAPAPSSPAAPPPTAAAEERAGGPWSSPLSVDHPLVGRIFRPTTATFVSVAEVERAVREADFALLGEQHDNADHHRLQARLVRAAAQGTSPPVVAWEMFDADQQAALDGFVTAHGADAPSTAAAALGPALGFEHSGWPAWSLYAPIAEAALQAHLPLVGANLSRQMAKGLVFHGPSVLPVGTLERLGLDRPMSPAALASLTRELSDAHCGHLPASHTDAMVLAQRARDATLGERLQQAASAGGRGGRGVLIAGAGHARTDRGVGAWLRESLAKTASSRQVVAVAFVEVADDETDPAAYARRFHPTPDSHGGSLPFDFVWFTPRTSDEDPCAAMLAPAKKSAAPSGGGVRARLSFEPARAPGDFGLPREAGPRREALVELAVWNEGGRGPDQKWHPQPRVVIGEPVELGAGGSKKSAKTGKKKGAGASKKGGKSTKKLDDPAAVATPARRTGGWDTAGAMRALRRYAYSGVRRCFDAALRETPDLEGRTVVDIQVDGSGHIVSAKASNGRAPDPRKHQTGMSSTAVRSCIANALRSVAVPPARGKRVSARVSVDVWPGDAALPAAEPPPLQNSLPAATFDPWLTAQRPAIEACFASLAERLPHAWGRLVLRVDVGPEGSVQASEFDSTFPDSATVQCVTRALVEAPRSLPAHPTPSRVVLAIRLARVPTDAPPPAEEDIAHEQGDAATGDESSESPAPPSN